jgi:hypothetical protein
MAFVSGFAFDFGAFNFQKCIVCHDYSPKLSQYCLRVAAMSRSLLSQLDAVLHPSCLKENALTVPKNKLLFLLFF